MPLDSLLRPPRLACRSAALRHCAQVALCLLLTTGAARTATASAPRESRVLRGVRWGSHAALGVTRWGATRIAGLAARGSRALPLSLRGLGVAGAGGLLVAGAHGLARARAAAERFDAAGDIAWGLRGLASYAAAAQDSTGWLSGAQGFGAVGALCQIGAGACRIRLGVQRHDRPLIGVGALDVAGGLLTLGLNLFGFSNPWVLGAYASTMAVREVYANREPIKAFARRATQKIRCAYGRCRARVAGALRSFAESLD